MARWLVFLITPVVFFLSGVDFSCAAQRMPHASGPSVKSPIPMQNKAADLTVQSATWSRPPQEGDSVGGSTILNVLVANKGNAPVAGCALKVECTALTGHQCPASMRGTANIPALGPGQSTMIPWPSLSQEKWPAGRFRLDIRADGFNQVKESNEKNNTAQINFTVKPNLLKKFSVIKPSSQGVMKKGVSMTAPHPPAQFQPLIIALKASKIRTEFPTYGNSLFWSMDIINSSNGTIAADTLEYKVSQTLNKGNPVTMTKGSIHQALVVGQSFGLKGDFHVCCGYDGMVVEIKNKMGGAVLATVGAPLPVEPLRARVQVASASFRTTPKPVAPLITFKNHASMPVKVKAMVYRDPPDSVNNYILADEREFWINAGDSTTNNYTGKLGAFDKLRVEITQVCPVIMCSKALCTEFPTWEGNFLGIQDE